MKIKNMNFLKKFLIKILPSYYYIPIKYYYNKIYGMLEPELFIITQLIKPNDLTIDIGGNKGVYTYHLWKLNAKVEVFEPNDLCYKILSNFFYNKSKITLHNTALSDNVGKSKLYIPLDENGLEHDASSSIQNQNFKYSREQIIYLKTLDSYNFKNVKFIKIDVEGHEYSVLKGALSTISDSKPLLLIEIEQRHNINSILEIFSFIMNLNYLGFYLDSNKMVRKITDFNINKDQCLNDFENNRAAYINNFIFVHCSEIEKENTFNLFTT